MTKVKSIDYDKLINYLLIVYAFCIPISKAGTNIFEVLILMLWVYQGNWAYKFQNYKLNPLITTFSIFIGFSIISILWASNVLFALEYIAKYRHFLIILVIYTSLNKKYIPHIFSAFLMAMLISEIISYGIFFHVWTYKDVSPSDPAPFMDHVSYSIYLAFTAMILLNKVFFEDTKKYKIIYALFFITVTANLFINGGRTGQVAFLAILTVLTILNTKHKLKAILFSIAFLSITLFTAYSTSPNFKNRVLQINTDIESMLYDNKYTGSLSTRLSLWIVGSDQIIDGITLGTGIGNELNKLEYYAQKNNFNYKHLVKYADHHNMFITYGIQLGQIGLILILIIFYLILTLKIREPIYKNLNIVFVISFFLWSFGNTTFHTMNPMVFFALFAGLFNALAQNKSFDVGEMKVEDNPISIKYYVKQFFQREKQRFLGKKIVDFPAGNGITSNIISSIGATPIPLDLFPEYFNIEGLTCTRANINEGIPLENEYADVVICQEGIEHFENQLLALREFNRILKPHGSLIITTPNASNMVGKLSYFLSENELFNKMMPQNELDDIWMSNQEISKEIYYGHIFLIGINKLRLLAKLSGFKIKNIENTRVKTTAIILLILFYPFIWFSNWRNYRRNLKKNQDFPMYTKKEIYGEIFKLATSPRLLINSHIFIEFEKDYNIDEVKDNLPSKHKKFGMT